jgi:hypothetical protein
MSIAVSLEGLTVPLAPKKPSFYQIYRLQRSIIEKTRFLGPHFLLTQSLPLRLQQFLNPDFCQIQNLI